MSLALRSPFHLIQPGSRGRRSHASCSKGLIGYSLKISPQEVVVPIQLYPHRMQLRQIAHQVRPGNGEGCLFQSSLKVDLEPQGEKTCSNMTDGGIISVVKERTYIQCTLFVPERPFDAPEALIGRRNLLGGELRVCRRHELSVKPCILLDRLLINPNRALLHFDKPRKSSIAYQCFGSPLLNDLPQTLQNRFSGR